MKELTTMEWRRLLTSFVADEEEMRPVMMSPFEQNGYVCATNSHILIRVAKRYIFEDYSTDKQTPDVANVMPEHNPISTISVQDLKGEFVRLNMDYDRDTVDCSYCDDECEVEWVFTDSDGDRHTMWAECPCCNGAGVFPNGYNKKYQVVEATVCAHYMLLVYRVMSTLGVDAAEITKGDKGQILFHVADGIDVLVMSLPVDEKKS